MLFDTIGNRSDPAVIMLNGSFVTGKGLAPIARKISDEFYVILPTYDGHHKDGGEFTTRQDQARKIIDYLKNEGIKEIALIQGASMGAEIALTLVSMLDKTDIKVRRCLFDGGPFFSFPKWFRGIMRIKFKSLVHQAQSGTEDEVVERFSKNRMVRWMVRDGDLSPYIWFFRDIAGAAPHMSDRSVCNESDACYTFDFPEASPEEQKRFYFTWSDDEPAYKSKKNIMKHYPYAQYGSAGNLGHCGLLSHEPDRYAELMKKLAEDQAGPAAGE